MTDNQTARLSKANYKCYLNLKEIHPRCAINLQLHFILKVKGKVGATPIRDLWGPEGSGRLRLQITRHSAHEGGKVVTLAHRPPLTPGISWYSFLEAESTLEHTEMSAATE